MKKIAHRIATARSGDWSALDAYLKEVARYSNLSHEETLELGRASRGGDAAAREVLVKSHLRLVVKIAHQYSGFGMALSDLIAEGNLGLMRAAELYDPKFGTKFLTYASVWIRQRIHRAINSQARVIRVPVWRSQRLRKLGKIQEEISSQLGHSASEAELTERLGISPEDLMEVNGDRVEVVSMDLTTGEEGERSLGDSLADESAEHPAARMDAEEMHDEMLACLADLDEREFQVLSLKFGLNAPAAVSFRELGRRMGVSHEWVRRIAELALVKVRRAFSESGAWSLLERKQRREKVGKRVRALKAVPEGGAGLLATPGMGQTA